MKLAAKMFLKENVTLTIRDRRGRFVRRMRCSNLITAVGRKLCVEVLGDLGSAPTHIAVGTGTTPANDADTALVTEVYRDLITKRIDGATAITYQLFISTADANGNTLTEAGVFTALNDTPVTGRLFARTIFPIPVVKSNAVTLTVSWTVTIASA